jgi:hypothetical protein
MQKQPLDPDVADTAPSDPVLTVYDEQHLITYLRMLADWREVARVVLHRDPKHDSDRARRAFDSHLSRAKWMTEHGCRHLLRGVEYCGEYPGAEPREITGLKAKPTLMTG